MNIVEYDEIREKLNEVKDACNFIPDVSTDEGYAKSKRVSLDVGKLKTALEKKRKDKKAYFLQGGREVDSQAKSILAELDSYQQPHLEAYKELDRLRKERETERKRILEDRVEHMRTLAEVMRDADSESIMNAMQAMNDEECLDFYEYTKQALEARNKAKSELSELYTKVLKQEKETAELERLRKESEERAKAEHEENIKREAAAKAEAEKEAAIKREQEAKEAALRAEQEKLEAEKRAIEAERQRKIEAEQAEIRAKEEVKKATKAARLNEIERQRKWKKRTAEEEAEREANKKHVGNVRREAKEALMQFVDEATAKKIVLAINNQEIPNISITY